MGEAVTKRLLATIAFIVLFHGLGLIPMPTVDKDYLQSATGAAERRVHVTALGMAPWVTGFLYVELWSFASRRGRRLRRAGTAGRRRLNAISVRAGVIFAVLQGVGVAIALARTPVLVWASSFGVLVTTLTFAAGSVLVFFLAQAVSRWGLGNGVCLFVILPIVEALIGFYRASTVSDPVLSGIEMLLGLAGVVLLIKIFTRGPMVVFSDSEKTECPSAFSAFPQGLVPLTWTYSVFFTVSSLGLVSDTTRTGMLRTPVPEACTAVLIVVISLCTFHLFSSRRRLDSSLPAGALPFGAEPSRERWLIPTTALLVVFGTIFNDRGSFLHLRLERLPSFVVLVILVAFMLDLVAEIRFRLKYGSEVAAVLEMDNVHGVSYLRGVLATHGIDSMAQAFHYRSLFFFLEPIVKMVLLVPSAEMAQAQEIIRAEKIDVV